jgi:hypothetical protein
MKFEDILEDRSNWLIPLVLKLVYIYSLGRRNRLRERLSANGWNFPDGFVFSRDRYKLWE